LQIAAATDRGQRMNALIAPTYLENKARINDLTNQLKQYPFKLDEESLSGEWELVYSDVELFRSRLKILECIVAFHDLHCIVLRRFVDFRKKFIPQTYIYVALQRPPTNYGCVHSPFFLAIEQALDTSPGIPLLGQWLGTSMYKTCESIRISVTEAYD
jgi:hypothetical protein